MVELMKLWRLGRNEEVKGRNLSMKEQRQREEQFLKRQRQDERITMKVCHCVVG